MGCQIFYDVLQDYKFMLIGIIINIIITIPLSIYVSEEYSLFSLSLFPFVFIELYLKYKQLSLKKYIFDEVKKDAEKKFVGKEKTEKIVIVENKKICLCKNRYTQMTAEEMKNPIRLIECKHSMFKNERHSVSISTGTAYFSIVSRENKYNIYYEIVYDPMGSRTKNLEGNIEIIIC